MNGLELKVDNSRPKTSDPISRASIQELESRTKNPDPGPDICDQGLGLGLCSGTKWFVWYLNIHCKLKFYY